jgi:hypothetical protein
LEWEMEAMRWRMPAEISKEDLEELVEASVVASEVGTPDPEDLDAARVLR